MTMTAVAAQPVSAPPVALPARPRVLLLTHRLPYPPDRGDRIRSFHMVRTLANHVDLAVACTSEEPVWLQHHQLLHAMADRVAIHPILSSVSHIRGICAFAVGKPVTPSCYFRWGLMETLLQWDTEKPFDAVVTFCTSMIHYSRRLLASRQLRNERARAAGEPEVGPIRHVLDLVDVDSMKWRSYARSTWSPMKLVYWTEARRLERIEQGKYDHFDAVTVVSQAEADAYREHLGDHPGLAVVHNGVDINYFTPLPDPDRHTIAFVGVLNYKPNTQGLLWFVKNIMPGLRKRLPDAKLLIVGRHPTHKILDLQGTPGIEVVGSVPDVRQYLGQASAIIAPLRIARGIQNKVLEAMASGRVVVASQGAAAGISARHNQHFLVADTPDDWITCLHKTLTDADYRQSIAHEARKLVKQEYAWGNAMQAMIDLVRG